MMNSRDEDQRVMEILAAARNKPAAERDIYLNSTCAGDEALRREVAEALSWEERMGGFLQQPVAVVTNEFPSPKAAPTTEVQFPAGLQFSQYRIESKLGEGGMSSVWLALDTRLGRRVAIKFLSDHLADVDARRRFQREAQMASSLNHPHIVTVYDVGEFEGRQYLVTEYVDGGTLKDWVKEKPRTPKDVAELLTGVADGLAAAHQAGILHRDIKPLNILVARNGYAKLADFGLAKLAESGQFDLAPHAPEAHTRQGLLLGTIAYMSPEQASGQPLDARSDIFSFGVVLHEMLSGKRPFTGRTDLEILKTIIHGELPPWSQEVPEAYRSVVEKALEKSAAERYQSMREMVVDLRRAQRSHASLSATPSREDAGSARKEVVPQAGTKRGPLTHKTWLQTAAVILSLAAIALLFVGAYRWLRPGPAPPPLPQQANLNPVPFTALAGQATSPSFSPDGSRVAFAWDGENKAGTQGFDLYVKALGSETLLRLTQHPAEWLSSAWSPDGTQIAFHRRVGSETGIYVVPALGGPEKKLFSTRVSWHEFVNLPFSTISWSPDGKWIAFADASSDAGRARLFFLSMETLEARQLPGGPNCNDEGLPAFSHSGESLAFWCDAKLYSSPFPDWKPRLVASFQAIPQGLTWSVDDQRVIYSLWNSSYKLWEISISNGSSSALNFAGSAAQPTVPSKGDKLAYRGTAVGLSIWRRDLLHPESPPVEIVPSSRAQYDARYSPDGKRIAFASLRSGMQGVWTSNVDGSNLVQISDPSRESGSPEWSPDGSKIAFDVFEKDHWVIYVANATEGIPRRLATNMTSEIRPYWSRDGKWIYFRSDQSDKKGPYRCLASGGDAIALSKDAEGFTPQESLDGTAIYFASHEEQSTLKKVGLPGQPGTETEVQGLPHLVDASSWTLSQDGIYFVSLDAPKSVRYFDLATRHTRALFDVDKNLGSGLSVSPDGRWMLYTQFANENSDIMLVDHFR